MNNTKIEWCDSTWNPVTGCLHGCEYCYARRIAERFGAHLSPLSGAQTAVLDKPDKFMLGNNAVRNSPYPFDFLPTLHKYKLDDYKNKSARNIFVCSMADLWGEWVPDEWIEEVFAACRRAPQHRYLFLTKNPARYKDAYRLGAYIDPYYWYGTTVNTQADINRINELPPQNFVSIEPLHGPIDLSKAPKVKWVIMGAETGNRKGKVEAQAEWAEEIIRQCKRDHTAVFMKDSLIPLVGEAGMLRQLPTQLKVRSMNYAGV